MEDDLLPGQFNLSRDNLIAAEEPEPKAPTPNGDSGNLASYFLDASADYEGTKI